MSKKTTYAKLVDVFTKDMWVLCYMEPKQVLLLDLAGVDYIDHTQALGMDPERRRVKECKKAHDFINCVD